MSVIELLAVLNKEKKLLNAAGTNLTEYEKDHPDEIEFRDALLEEMSTTEDPNQRAEIIEKLSNMDGYNSKDIPLTWLRHDVQDLKNQIKITLNCTRCN